MEGAAGNVIGAGNGAVGRGGGGGGEGALRGGAGGGAAGARVEACGSGRLSSSLDSHKTSCPSAPYSSVDSWYPAGNSSRTALPTISRLYIRDKTVYKNLE